MTVFNRFLPSKVRLIKINKSLLFACLIGLLFPLGLAPFHLPGFTFISIAILFSLLQQKDLQTSFKVAFWYGLGCLGLGVSWVYVSIHEYGHIPALASAAITLVFIAFLSLYFGFMAAIYAYLARNRSHLFRCFLFSAMWILMDFTRSTFFGGFPWLLIGFGQMDTPFKYLLPIVGIYGAGFFACLASTFLASGLLFRGIRRAVWFVSFTLLLLTPNVLKHQTWDKQMQPALTTGVVQANLSMRDKWDESLFWQMLHRYKAESENLFKNNQLIVLPESAIPVPASYVSDFLDELNESAKKNGSAIVLGTIQSSYGDDTKFHNSMIALGESQGAYQKQHLVPFGEYIPSPFLTFFDWFSLPVADLRPGDKNQPLIFIQNHPIASLICYELAYPQLLRKQLPLAEWIVSISDDGWFGRSLAMYQQLQMAQALSMQTARYQILANNDGLSSIIDAKGNLLATLPAYTAGTLESRIHPNTAITPWVLWGDAPIFLACCLIIFSGMLYPIATYLRNFKKINEKETKYCGTSL